MASVLTHSSRAGAFFFFTREVKVMNDEKMLDVREAADRLNVSPFTIRRMLAERSLQFRRIGSGRGRLRISERDLREYQEQRTVSAVAA